MTDPNRNILWSRVIVEELFRNGVRTVCLCPGSRNTPLTVAFTRHGRCDLYSHLDERSAAFFALGHGQLSGRPAAVVTTSGTATAECHPAVLEADRARVPLLILTADRPPALRDSGANQTVDQTHLYSDAVRWFRDVPEPEADPRKLRALRTSVCRGVQATKGSPPGPVHFNLPFRKPLEPTRVPGDVPEGFEDNHALAMHGRDQDPFVRIRSGKTVPSEPQLSHLAESLETTDRGLICAGPTPPANQSVEALLRLSEITGFPVLADPLSGVRFQGDRGGATVLGGYDAYLERADALDLPDPRLVLRFGAAPTASSTLSTYLTERAAHQWIVDPHDGWPEVGFTAEVLLRADTEPLIDGLVSRVTSSDAGDWQSRYREVETRYWQWIQRRRDERGDDLFEGFVWEPLLDNIPSDALLFVGNSLPVRDLVRFGRPRTDGPDVLANRGVSGIDGNVSTALGAAAGTGRPLVAVVGDITLYHDLNALLGPKRFGIDATVLVMNNDGGGIFYRLPIRDHDPPFNDYVRTPHGLRFENAARQFDLDYTRVDTASGLKQALETRIGSPGIHLVEILTDARRDETVRQQIQEELDNTLA